MKVIIRPCEGYLQPESASKATMLGDPNQKSEKKVKSTELSDWVGVILSWAVTKHLETRLDGAQGVADVLERT